MEISILAALIGLLAGIISALATWSIAERRIAVENVTAERAKWRKNIRAQALKAHRAILRGDEARLRSLKSEFRALLSPFDAEDRQVLERLTANGTRKKRKKRAKKFDRQISLLLKHDWEGAKLEAGSFLRRWTLEAKRHELGCDTRKGCRCRVKKDLSWRDKYRIRRVQAAVLGVSLIVALFIVACVLWNCLEHSVTKKASKHVSLDVGAYVRENPGESQGGV